MFQGLQQGASIYILHKNEARMDVGRIISSNTHLPQYNPSQPQAMFNGMVTDLTVSVGGDTVPFLGLPANASVANFNDKGLFISEDQGLVVNEITTLRDNSKRIVDSYEMNKEMLERYDALLLSLNPEKQREARSMKELADLRSELSDMKQMLSAILGTKIKED